MERTVTLIIATYNWPDALRLCLLSVEAQTQLPNEVIIADDGSGPKTKALVDLFQSSFPIPIKHVWQEDSGFRKSRIVNQAFALASFEYVIQVDGDVFLHHDFIKDHIRAAKPNFLLQGSRVMLGARYSEKLLMSGIPKFNLFAADTKRLENAIRLPFLSDYLLQRYRNRYPIYFARGANMSFWKEDLYAVNGYNESYQGWGHEDSDLTLRLMNYGVRKAVIKFAAIVYHLHHTETKTPEQESKNKAIMEHTLKQKIHWTENGINKYL